MVLNVKINNYTVSVNNQFTILEICELLYQKIPKFCYNSNLAIAGNCRMCLIEVTNSIKPVIACTTLIVDDLNIKTKTPLVKKARENILEFLLINHPLDCPICDQGGECDLQDQTMEYSSVLSRFFENKRSVENKQITTLISTIMNRCLHFTKCVRFIADFTYIKNLNLLGRGNNMEIGYYIKEIYDSNLLGNIVDLCPVGALVSKPFKSISRRWELKSYNSFDLFDNNLNFIRIEIKNSQIFRILPNLSIKQDFPWITNKTRYSFDILNIQRIRNPRFLNTTTSWLGSYKIIQHLINIYSGSKIAFIYGSLLDLETTILIKKFSQYVGSSNLYTWKILNKPAMFTEDYYNFFSIKKPVVGFLFNIDIVENFSFIYIKLRRYILLGFLFLVYCGSKIKINYTITMLGLNILTFIKFFEGRNKLCKYINKYQSFIFLCKSNFNYNNIRLKNYLNLKFYKVNLDLTLLNNFAVGTNLGNNSVLYLNKLTTKIKLLYIIGVINLPLNFLQFKKIIYQGSNYTKVAQYADIILPSSSIFEKKVNYITASGIKELNKIINKDVLIKDDWKILFFIINFLQLNKLTIKNIFTTYSNIFYMKIYKIYKIINIKIIKRFGYLLPLQEVFTTFSDDFFNLSVNLNLLRTEKLLHLNFKSKIND